MAKDKIHDAVKNALIKDGWTITADPFSFRFADIKLFADLAAERLLAAQQGKRQIVVEAKSFLGASPIHDLELALGQYVLYRNFLRETHPEHQLYLAIGDKLYNKVFKRKSVQYLVAAENLRLLVFDLTNEVIVSWRN